MLNYHRWVDRMQVIERKIRPSSVYLLSLSIVAFLIGVLTWDLWSSQYPLYQETGSKREVELSKALTAQAEVLAARNLELSVEREANNNMQQMFAVQHQKQKELERELAFYRSVMAPEYQADGVAIHGLEMTPSLLSNQYRIKLILTQLQKRKQALKGHAELTFVGLQQGKVSQLTLASLVEDKLEFSFRYFQVLETELILPADFELSRIEVKVTVPSSRWNKGASVEQSFSAQELFNTTSDVPSSSDAQNDASDDNTNNNNETISPEPRLLLEQNGQVSDNSAQQTDVRGSND
ncbi:DUF6776 family protein [Shewanella sp. Isolate11]|uniref:DUF6776 family protein n=1 Tax=Shewanella sp. Isolate11 TaxID=2908530 RepID=UPI001EFDDC86|nr:DUF6776 family protein [Shewanella sp. Isolate11]MCG9695904.1 hypothetical protein [Shewanella sp. Isolate11]